MRRVLVSLVVAWILGGGLPLAAEGEGGKDEPAIPRKATALCKDRTWSMAANRRGACSGHGGIEIWYGKPPRKATARCKDGTYSKSKKASGTCSGHGGVAFWLTQKKADE